MKHQVNDKVIIDASWCSYNGKRATITAVDEAETYMPYQAQAEGFGKRWFREVELKAEGEGQ